MLPDFLKALLADHMFDAAGVGGGGFPIDPQKDQPVGQQGVPLIHPLRDFPALVRQQQEIPVGHLHIAVFPQLLHGHADAGLGKAQLHGDIDGTHPALALLEHQDGFQIILSGFLDFHARRPALLCDMESL